jgi:leucyl aminopeptidase
LLFASCLTLQIFRVLMSEGWTPDRTVEFHTYAAEEAGLLGSQDVARAYQLAGIKVYAQMQLGVAFAQ